MALLTLFTSLAYLFNFEIDVTVGRVTILGKDIYTLTGGFESDWILAWMSVLAASIAGITTRRSVLFNGLLAIIATSGIMLLLLGTTEFFPVASMMYAGLMAAYYLSSYRIGFLARGFLYVLTVVEGWKIVYLLLKALIGRYIFPATPVYFNIVLWYYLSFTVPLVLAAILAIGIYRISPLQVVFKRKAKNIPERMTQIRVGRCNLGIPLIVGLVLALSISSLPYMPSLNMKGIPVNTDWIYYKRWLDRMVSGDFSVLVEQSDRPLYLLLLYSARMLTGLSTKTIAVYHNIITLLLYTLSVYLISCRWRGGETATYAALITPFSPVFLSFIYGGFQADLFTISVMFISIYMLMGKEKRETVIGGVLFILSMFLHEWTWTQYTLVFVGYLFFKLWRNSMAGKELLDWRDRLWLFFVVIGFAVDFGKHLALGMFSAATVVEKSHIFHSSMGFLSSIHWYVDVYTGGSLGHPVFFIVAMLGLAALDMDLISVALVLSLVPVAWKWNVITYRLILNSPLIPLAAYGLTRLERKERILVLIVMAGIGLWRLYSFIPGLSLTS